ncbi:MAG: 50S ribosomal protein L13 [Nitrosopumilus sp.]|nr:50S ribosomal protein L13 [Nitrosopumilus sp.]MDH5568244.1 50S ribosomal protein L13 [Nitrosopumilus sp.]
MAEQKTVIRTDRPVVVDGTDHIAGRLASNVAKLLIQGNRVSVVNCEKIMMSGTRANQIKEAREFLEINSIINYKHGPVHYRRPDTMMAKMIRQMLPFDRKPSGKESYQRLRTYIGSPKEIKSLEKIQFEKAIIKRSAANYTSIGELCRVIGWTE